MNAVRFCTSVSLFALAVAGFSANGVAQTVSVDAARFPNVDQNGVDLVNGSFNLTVNEGSIGEGESTLAMVRTYVGSWRDDYDVRLRRATVSGQIQVTITERNETVLFRKVSGVFVADNADGSTLTEIGGGNSYVYTKSDGEKLNFPAQTVTSGPSALSSTICTSSVTGSCFLMMGSRVQPNNRTVTVNWALEERCYQNNTEILCGESAATNIIRGVRIGSVTNNAGYSMTLAYASNSFTPGPTVANWYRRTSVQFKNTGATSATWPTISYAYPTATTTQTTDIGGRVWNFTYAGSYDGGALTAVKRPGAAANNIAISYTPSLSSVTKDGVTTGYSRSVTGTVSTMVVTDANSNTLTAIGDTSLSRVTKITDQLNRVTNFAYDTSARPTETTFPEGNKVVSAYDARGNITSTTYKAKPGSGLADLIVTASYPASCANPVICNKPTWTKDAKGNQTDYTYNATHGGILTIDSPAATAGGIRPEIRYSYSVVGGVTLLTGTSACQTTASCTGGADETKVTTTYTTNLSPSTVTAASGTGSVSSTVTYGYDILGNLTSVDGPLPGTVDTTVIRYDAARQVVGIVQPDPDGGAARLPSAQRVTYNNDGQVTLRELGTVVDQSDSAWANFTSLEQAATTYDGNARPIRIEGKGGGNVYSVTQMSYDALGRPDCVAQRMDPAQWASQSVVCTPQTTGPNGADRITKTVYDAASQVTQTQVAVGTSDAATAQTNTWSNNGHQLTVKDGESNLTTYEYDGFDRLSKTRYPVPAKGGNASSTTDYEQLTYDANGNVTQRRLRDSTSISYTFDNLDRVTFKDVPNTASGEYDITYAYDLLGRATSITNAAGHFDNATYDALGRTLSETSVVGTKSLQYDVAGRMTRMTWPDGVYVTYDYDNLGLVTAIRENGATSGIGVLATYGYDSLKRRTSITRGNGTTTSYGYDAISRLSSLTQDLAGTANDLTISGFVYNPASQITALSRSNDAYAWTGHYNVNRNYTTNGLNQYPASGTTTLGYDARGNLTTSGSTIYTYTSENRLATGAGSTLLYDPIGRLLQVVVGTGGTRFDYVAGAMVSELDTSNVVQRRYVYGPGADEPIVWYEGSGTINRRWLHTDERGSVVAVSDSSGNAIAINRYDEYGIPQSGNVGRFQYTGQAWLAETGMSYYKARMYSPTLGRFMQTDPIGYHDGLNWYAYVKNDPINKWDPSGLADDSDDPKKCQENCGPPIVVNQHQQPPSLPPPSPFDFPQVPNLLAATPGGGSGGVAQNIPCTGGGCKYPDPKKWHPRPDPKPKEDSPACKAAKQDLANTLSNPLGSYDSEGQGRKLVKAMTEEKISPYGAGTLAKTTGIAMAYSILFAYGKAIGACW